MKFTYGPETVNDFDQASRLEWLETNGIGGWAGSTVSGAHTRRYHGLLVAATRPPLGRMVLLSKLEEELIVDGECHALGCNRFPSAIHPQGHKYLESFTREWFPTFTYHAGGVVLRKTVVAAQGENTTLLLYEVLRAHGPFTMTFLPLVTARDYHSLMTENSRVRKTFDFKDGRYHTRLTPDAPDLFIHVPGARFEERQDWYRNFELLVERYRGLDIFEDLYTHGKFVKEVGEGDRFGIIVSTGDDVGRDPFALADAERERREGLVQTRDPFHRTLALAADQFIVRRGEDLKTILAGYHWFSDWGRDTMIALPGLCLTQGRYGDAKKIFRAFARHMDQGMIPNRFPDEGEEPEYNTVDATLWMFVALKKYRDACGDDAFIREHMLAKLDESIAWHERGTRYGIKVDEDGLLLAGERGTQLTWMDAKVFDWVVTPREGKAVEINALWYNALRIAAEFHRELGDRERAANYKGKADRVKARFEELFWNEKRGCLFDVVQKGEGVEDVRPNQVFALSLPYPLVEGSRAESILQIVEKELLTPRGLRSLERRHRDYHPRYGGDQKARDGAYHQGTVWGWLIGPYISALVKVRGEAGRKQAREWLESFKEHFFEAGIGTCSEIFDGEPPHAPRGCIAQAWTVSEVYRALKEDILQR